MDGGSAAGGSYDFEFTLYDARTSGTQQGSDVTQGDVAQCTAFLASDGARMITGQTIYADGGRLGLNYTV